MAVPGPSLKLSLLYDNIHLSMRLVVTGVAMKEQGMEGQLDFLGLISEYTDDQGATVRVREPARKRLRPVIPEDYEQISLNFSDAPEEEKSMEAVRERKPAGIFEHSLESSPQQVLPKKETPQEEVTENRPKQPKEEPRQPKAEAKQAETKPEKKPKKQPETKEEPTEKPAEGAAKEPEDMPGPAREQLFKQCKRCWCFDCKHNSRNQAIPREMCGIEMPCPACNDCIAEDMATICEIGNAREGCRTRALEEGILTEEDTE